ncbi:MAG: DUF1289 domain-containing protein [Ponticaulis sp.]|nr:DUF1289 domain-containing protein [Ponticaulis sp.]|tara:strand:- start:2397 stop:2594 length:198 start_codon:yes stop_codon:yes gene_type:complete
MTVNAIKTPCIKVCVVDGQTGWCLGCGRALREIAEWTKYTDQQRSDLIKESESRLKELSDMGKLG